MRKLIVFNQVSLDGYFAGMNGDISWAKKDPTDAEKPALKLTRTRTFGNGNVLLCYEPMG